MTETETTETSRTRLLAAGKSLFSQFGYEQTSTSAIARQAKTSESQLVRYFGDKSGLLEAIFNQAWTSLNDQIALQIAGSEHGRDAVLRVFALVTEAFARDHDIAFLVLFEGRRLRGNELLLSKGFLHFYQLFQHLVERGQHDGSFRDDVGPDIISSALMGTAEGMMRDRMIAERTGNAGMYDAEAIRRTFEAMINGLDVSR